MAGAPGPGRSPFLPGHRLTTELARGRLGRSGPPAPAARPAAVDDNLRTPITLAEAAITAVECRPEFRQFSDRKRAEGKGVSETIIAMRIGHTSPALIRSTYGHLIGTVGQRAAEATAALVPRKGKKPKDQKPKRKHGKKHKRRANTEAAKELPAA